MSFHEVERYIEALLLGDGKSRRPRFRRFPKQPLQALIPNLLYRCRLLDTVENRTVSLTLFLRLGDLGGAMWEQEMRLLERVTGMAHPALPELEDGGYLPNPDGGLGAAYIRTKTRGTPGDPADLQQLFRERRGDALPHLWLLADALAMLADAHIAHRMLWPGNLDVTKIDDTIENVRLSRFEMGALISNLFDSGHDLSLAQVRDLYLQQPPASLLYTPPERLRFLFGKPDGHLGGPQGDVFSLGMMTTEWLLGAVDDLPVQQNFDDIMQRQDAARRMLVRRSNELPSSLAQILTDMLDSRPDGRPTPYQVAQQVNAAYSDAREVLADDLPTAPYVLAYMPADCDKTLLVWRAINASALTPEGQEQLVDLIERDTRGAEILHSPHGAEGFADGDPAKLRRAKVVVVGHEITWFGETLWVQQDGIFEYEEILVIKFVRFTSDVATKLDGLRLTALTRRVPVTEAIAMPTETEVATFWSTGRPAWPSLVLDAESGRVLDEDEKSYLEALDWYLRYQRALLTTRTYAYVLEPIDKPGRAVLRWDQATDMSRRLADPLQRMMVQDTRRLALADFVASGGQQAGIDAETMVRVSLAESPNGFKSARGPFTVVGTVSTYAVEIDTLHQRDLPQRGWLQLESDRGTVPQINRQADARIELETRRSLLQQLIRPQVRPILGNRWESAGGSLSGDGRDAVVAMLKHGALFALQGPPGTGKTEVTAQAVAEYVAAKPRARVLVSAQSHDALDNLAGRILDKLGMTTSASEPARLDRLALRVEPRRARDRADARVEAFRSGRLADGVIAYSRSQAQHWLAWRRGERPTLIPVVQKWLGTLATSRLELSRRAQAAANVVFATTGAATSRNLVNSATDEPFHWVLVEEAARAWPTELALPLVRGSRWTLIGDHAQIGAFSRADIDRFLLECKDHGEPEISAMYKARDSYSRAFSTFAELFDSGKSDVPRMTLTQGYRMNEQISTLIGDIFYADSGGLQACRDPAPHPLTWPDYLLESRLIWIDTGEAEHARGFWYNENEADLCARIVRAMQPSPGTVGGPTLAILTPYRKQVSLLEQRLSEHASKVYTIDGFQGREADVVVASLVRDVVAPDGTPISSVGHVASASRANVLLSRARELLVVVGRWDVYASHAGPKWRAVAEHFRERGMVVRAAKVRQP
ncbi:MAG: AAA domain-containing protein [Umezawaea sp.]